MKNQKLTKAQTKMINKAKNGVLQFCPHYLSAPAHAADMRVIKALQAKGLVIRTEKGFEIAAPAAPSKLNYQGRFLVDNFKGLFTVTDTAINCLDNRELVSFKTQAEASQYARDLSAALAH